jgi:hypothetical protein
MSWGERSCMHLHVDSKPCTPELRTCNVDCPLYQSNGLPPDSLPKGVIAITVSAPSPEKRRLGWNRHDRRRLARRNLKPRA